MQEDYRIQLRKMRSCSLLLQAWAEDILLKGEKRNKAEFFLFTSLFCRYRDFLLNFNEFFIYKNCSINKVEYARLKELNETAVKIDNIINIVSECYV